MPPLITAGGIQSINFSMYEYFKRLLKNKYHDISHLHKVFYAGTISGSIISVITTPITCVKVQQQLSTSKGIIACSKHMYNTYGIRAFYRGYSTYFIMESFGRGIYLYIYEGTKICIRRNYHLLSKDKSIRNNSVIVEENLMIRMMSAATAGCLSWLSVYPLDVIKSRMQLDINRSLYSSTIDCASKIYHQHGVRGFSKGLTYTLIRAAPVASTILPVYEYTKDTIENSLTNYNNVPSN